jgi:hypothetical protein
MLWCERVAPFGKPVVPDVYWMLMGSSKARAAEVASRTLEGIWSAAFSRAAQLSSPM